MKYLFFLCLASVFCFNAAAQLKADAGYDAVWCLGFWATTPDSPILGAIPTASNGTPPYNYLWTIAELGYLAKDYLNSDTIPNPQLKDVPPFGTANQLHFLLKVTDANMMAAFDTVQVSFSRWGAYLPIFRTKDVEDTIIVRAPVGLPSFPPIKYTWYPGDFLSDPNALAPLCWAPYFMYYEIMATDALGCTSEANNCSVFVNPTAVNEQKQTNDLLILPTPANATSVLKCSQEWLGSIFRVFSSNGQLVLQKEITTVNTPLHFPQIKSGIYFYQVSSQAGLYRCGKITYID